MCMYTFAILYDFDNVGPTFNAICMGSNFESDTMVNFQICPDNLETVHT